MTEVKASELLEFVGESSKSPADFYKALVGLLTADLDSVGDVVKDAIGAEDKSKALSRKMMVLSKVASFVEKSWGQDNSESESLDKLLDTFKEALDIVEVPDEQQQRIFAYMDSKLDPELGDETGS
jgi:hypothetical protein